MKRSPVLSSVLAMALASLLLLLADGPALGDLYEWVDPNGTVGYADSLEKVPPEYRAWAYHNRKKVQERPPITTPVEPQSETVPAPEPSASPQDSFVGWKERITKARAELEDLKRQRQEAQKEYAAFRAELFRRYMADPDVDAKLRAKLADLDDKISKKEYEIDTTIPDAARHAGVPSSVLSQ